MTIKKMHVINVFVKIFLAEAKYEQKKGTDKWNKKEKVRQ